MIVQGQGYTRDKATRPHRLRDLQARGRLGARRAQVPQAEGLQPQDAGEEGRARGQPRRGKTVLAVACGTAACAKGMRVSFVSVPNLVTEIKEDMSLNEFTRYMRNFERYDLVILDDLGYCSFSKEYGEVLFNLLSNRNQKGSMVITTNLTFDRWNEVFNDEVLTGAIVDCIGHKARVVNMTGESYRVLETEGWLRENWEKAL